MLTQFLFHQGKTGQYGGNVKFMCSIKNLQQQLTRTYLMNIKKTSRLKKRQSTLHRMKQSGG